MSSFVRFFVDATRKEAVMSHNIGEIYSVDKRPNQKKYALLVGIARSAEAPYTLINLAEARPFEFDSAICIGRPNLKGRTKKEKEREKDQQLKISGPIFRRVDLSPYGEPVGVLGKEKIRSIVGIINNRDAYKKERARIASVKDELHKRLSVLKKQKELNRINGDDYSSIEKEMDEISERLGYEFIDHGPRYKQFREAPSKSIKIYLGGRGG